MTAVGLGASGGGGAHNNPGPDPRPARATDTGIGPKLPGNPGTNAAAANAVAGRGDMPGNTPSGDPPGTATATPSGLAVVGDKAGCGKGKGPGEGGAAPTAVAAGAMPGEPDDNTGCFSL